MGELTGQSLGEEELRCEPSTCAVGVAAKKNVGEVGEGSISSGKARDRFV